MWIESQDKNHLVNVDRIHKRTEKRIEYERVFPTDPFGSMEINYRDIFSGMILDENGLILGEYSTEEQFNKVWKQLKEFIQYGMTFDIEDMTLYEMPEDEKEVSKDEENK